MNIGNKSQEFKMRKRVHTSLCIHTLYIRSHTGSDYIHENELYSIFVHLTISHIHVLS